MSRKSWFYAVFFSAIAAGFVTYWMNGPEKPAVIKMAIESPVANIPDSYWASTVDPTTPEPPCVYYCFDAFAVGEDIFVSLPPVMQFDPNEVGKLLAQAQQELSSKHARRYVVDVRGVHDGLTTSMEALVNAIPAKAVVAALVDSDTTGRGEAMVSLLAGVHREKLFIMKDAVFVDATGLAAPWVSIFGYTAASTVINLNLAVCDSDADVPCIVDEVDRVVRRHSA